MSKKIFGKLLVGAAVVGAAAAIAAYVKQSHSKEDLMDDFDDFDDELDEENTECSASSNSSDDRHYVTIPLDKAAQEEAADGVSDAEPENPAASSEESDAHQEEKEVYAFNLEE